MIPEIGHFALILALCMAALMSVVPMIGSFTGQHSWMAMAKPAALFSWLCHQYIELIAAFNL